MSTTTKSRKSVAAPKEAVAPPVPPVMAAGQAEPLLAEPPLHTGDWIALWACVAAFLVMGAIQVFQMFGIPWFHWFS